MRTVLLAGGTGGAKLAHGLQQALPPGELTVIVNVGDDSEQYGLLVCPDLDTILYTLAGLADPIQGWGLAGDTNSAMAMLGRYGAETWFRIGDGDMATHVHRAALMRRGASLSDATAAMATALGVFSHLLPATDDRLRTVIETDSGQVDFQTYFVKHGQADAVRGLRFDGAETARASEAALAALREAEVIVIGPSNPLVSIGPILVIPGYREALASADVPRVGVSGIVAGRALRGPADRMLKTLGHEATAHGVAALYAGLLDHFVIDEADAELAPRIAELGMEPVVLPTIMRSDEDRARLAQSIIGLT